MSHETDIETKNLIHPSQSPPDDDKEPASECASTPKCFCFGVLLLIFVLVMLITAYVLWAVKYRNYRHTSCQGGNETSTSEDDIDTYEHDRAFAFLILLSLLWVFEYLVLGVGFLYVLYNMASLTCVTLCNCNVGCKRCIDWIITPCSPEVCYKWCKDWIKKTKTLSQYFFISLGVLSPLSLIGFAKAVVSIAMEVENMPCESIFKNVYITYSVFELFNTQLGYIVRVLMLTAAFMVKKKWSTNLEEHLQCNRDIPKQEADEQHPKLTIEELCRKEATEEHYKQLKNYHKIGKEVQQIMSPFLTWFLLPWAIYSLTTTIDPLNFASPWTETNLHVHHLYRILYLLYIVMKTGQLLAQYMCALMMNQHHKDYYDRMRDNLVKKYDHPEYQAVASQLVIEYKERFDFHPTVLFINPRINVDNPLFLIIILLTAFVTTSKLV